MPFLETMFPKKSRHLHSSLKFRPIEKQIFLQNRSIPFSESMSLLKFEAPASSQ
jgi:hypothetical protein